MLKLLRRRHRPAGHMYAILFVILGAMCGLSACSTGTASKTLAATTTQADTQAPTATAVQTPTQAPAAADDFSSAIRSVAQQVMPAIVQITNQQVELDQYNQPFTVPAGVGSAIIYDGAGHILTNNHVVDGASQLQVTLPGGASYPAKLVGADPHTDLAVVQVEGANLPVAQLGASHQLRVGDWVVAIGNALALRGGPTVSAGVVGALGRTVQEPAATDGTQGPYLFDLIQTDAPINPGNSGGALVNLQGEVVGINTLVAGQAEPGVDAQGIGFAIAIDTAKPIADRLVANGRVVHPSLGIGYLPLNPAIAAQLGIETRSGALIRQVAPGSPAAAAGLQVGDVITEIDGTALTSDSSLPQIVNSHKPGDTVTLTVERGNQTLTLRVTLGRQPSS